MSTTSVQQKSSGARTTRVLNLPCDVTYTVPECTGMFIPCTSRPHSVRGVLSRSATRKQEGVTDSLLRNRLAHRFRQWNRAGYGATACRCCLGNAGSAVAITESIAQFPKQF